MDVKSLQEVNSVFFSKRQSRRQHPKTALEVMFWISVILIIIAVLSFNYNSFLTRPVFGYSLYLTESEKNLMLVKNAEDFDPGLTAETVYQRDQNLYTGGVCGNNHKTVEVGIVKATSPKLGKVLSFIIANAHIIIIIAAIWITLVLVMDKILKSAGTSAKSNILNLQEKEVRK